VTGAQVSARLGLRVEIALHELGEPLDLGVRRSPLARATRLSLSSRLGAQESHPMAEEVMHRAEHGGSVVVRRHRGVAIRELFHDANGGPAGPRKHRPDDVGARRKRSQLARLSPEVERRQNVRRGFYSRISVSSRLRLRLRPAPGPPESLPRDSGEPRRRQRSVRNVWSGRSDKQDRLQDHSHHGDHHTDDRDEDGEPRERRAAPVAGGEGGLKATGDRDLELQDRERLPLRVRSQALGLWITLSASPSGPYCLPKAR
jgi:hypothetical protein